MDKLRMQKKEPAGRKNGERRLFTSVNLRLEHAALDAPRHRCWAR